MGGKRLRVEALLAAAASPLPPPLHDLVPDPTLAALLPEDVPHLLRLLPTADLYLQDEVEVALHPTLTRVWCRRGRRGQRLVEAPGTNRKRYGFGLVDWRDGWFDWTLVDEHVRGAVLVALDEHRYLGDRSQSDLNIDVALPRATLLVDDRRIVDRGRLIV